MIEVSAPGKIHLIGEHAVVYGFPAIIAAIDRRVKILAEKANKIKIKNNIYKKETEFSLKEVLLAAKKSEKLWNLGNEKKDFSELFHFLKSDFWCLPKVMVGLILNSFKMKSGVSLIINSDLPFGVGLGSSAALASATIKSIAALYDIQISNPEINNLAFEIEKLNHGRPSGGDNSACTFGGTIWFEKRKIEFLSLPDFFKKIIIISTPRENLTSGELIEKVRNLKTSFRNSRIKNIANATYQMKEALRNRKIVEIKNLINLAQDNLAELGVSTPKIDEIIKKIRKIGGAAKISGAGGGGNVICFHRDRKKLIQLLKKMKVNFWEAKLGVKGVRLEKSEN